MSENRFLDTPKNKAICLYSLFFEGVLYGNIKLLPAIYNYSL